MVTLAGYCVHSTVVPAIVPKIIFAPSEEIHVKELLLSNGGPKRVETLKSAGVCGTACIGRAKQEKFWEVRQATHTQDGQDRELCPILHLIPEVLHLSNLPTPSQPKT